MDERTHLVIIPTYNECQNILRVCEEVVQCAPEADLLVVDDNSPDGTADRAEVLSQVHPQISVLRRTGPRGLGRSYIDGYRYALEKGYGHVVQMDADLSHPPDRVPALVEAARHADVAIGSRYCPGGALKDWPVHRILLSRFANRYVAAITGVPIRDCTAGFRCHTRHALERIGIDSITSTGYAFQVEMSYRAHLAGLKIVEVPITFTDRTLGVSKISRSVILESMIMPWKLRFSGLRRTMAIENR